MSDSSNHTDKEILREVFQRFDVDGSGAIEARELVRLMRSAGQSLTRAEADSLIAEFDKNSNGRLEFQEFVDMMAAFAEKSSGHGDGNGDSRDAGMVDVKRRIFDLLDRNRDGFISREELAHAMNDVLREGLNDAELDEMMAAADNDRDGFISFDEFSSLAASMGIFR